MVSHNQVKVILCVVESAIYHRYPDTNTRFESATHFRLCFRSLLTHFASRYALSRSALVARLSLAVEFADCRLLWSNEQVLKFDVVLFRERNSVYKTHFLLGVDVCTGCLLLQVSDFSQVFEFNHPLLTSLLPSVLQTTTKSSRFHNYHSVR